MIFLYISSTSHVVLFFLSSEYGQTCCLVLQLFQDIFAKILVFQNCLCLSLFCSIRYFVQLYNGYFSCICNYKKHWLVYFLKISSLNFLFLCDFQTHRHQSANVLCSREHLLPHSYSSLLKQTSTTDKVSIFYATTVHY